MNWLIKLNSEIAPSEFLAILDEIIAKTEELEIDTSNGKVAMGKLYGYIQASAERSAIMANELISLTEAYPGEIIAATVGTTHADEIAALLKEANVSYVIIYPSSRFLENDPTKLPIESFSKIQYGYSPGLESTIGDLLDGNKKPPPTGNLARLKVEHDMRTFFHIFLNRFPAWWAENSGSFDDTSTENQILNSFLESDSEAYFKLLALNNAGIDFGKIDIHFATVEQDYGLAFDFTLPDGTKFHSIFIAETTEAASTDLERHLIQLHDRLLSGEADSPPTFRLDTSIDYRFLLLHRNSSNTWYGLALVE